MYKTLIVVGRFGVVLIFENPNFKKSFHLLICVLKTEQHIAQLFFQLLYQYSYLFILIHISLYTFILGIT